MRHKFVSQIAERQQKWFTQNPISRWNIISSEDSLGGVLAVSTNLGTLAIDPTQSGSLDELLPFLSNLVYKDICSSRNKKDCLYNVGRYIRKELESDKQFDEKSLRDKIESYIQTRINTPIDSVLLKKNLNEPTIDEVNRINNDALFFVVNNLYVNPTKISNPAILANQLTEVLNIPKNRLESLFAIKVRRHLEILRKMSINSREIVKKRIESERAMLASIPNEGKKREKWLQEHAIFRFLKTERNLVRYYPEWSALGQITGFVDGGWRGKYGIEGYFENELQSESPIQYITKDVRWRPIRDYAHSWALTVKSGSDIVLTIDRNIQKEISEKLERSVKGFRANKWSAIVMDPKTGAIIAMVNYPNFDPNEFTKVYEMEPVLYEEYPNPSFDLFQVPLFVVDTQSGTVSTNIDGKRIKMRSATDEEIGNFAIIKYKFKNSFGIWNYKNDIIGALYEPWSVFKAVTVAIALDAGEINPNDRYYDKGYVELDMGGGIKRRIYNVSSRCLGYNTYQNALSWSCNVGMVNIVEKIGRTLFAKYVQDFGFGKKVNITMDWEVFSQIGSPTKWSRIQFFNMSFGQGISATMLQMAAAYSTIANGGVYMQPYIVEKIVHPNGKIIETVPTPIRRVIKEETAKATTAMLAKWTREGFAKSWEVPWYAIAWKTGTSQIPYKGTYENLYFKKNIGHTITSYGWYAPAHNPKFVLIVSIDRPRSGVYSETTSSALWKEIASYLLDYYKVPKN